MTTQPDAIPAVVGELVATAAKIRGIAGVIRQYGTCAPAALDFIADELESTLSALTAEPKVLCHRLHQPNHSSSWISGDYTGPESKHPAWSVERAYSFALTAEAGKGEDDQLNECGVPGCGEYEPHVHGDHFRNLADMLDPAKQADTLRRAVDSLPKNEFFPIPAGLHPHTVNLVARFAAALADKLAKAERKYGYSDGWSSPDWMDECRAKLMEHVAKGDPRDVAAYCAFLWHHDERTALSTATHAGEWVTDEVASDVLTRYLANSPNGDYWPPERARELRIAVMRDAIRNSLAASPRGASTGEQS
jgi:hypothetical protein